MAQAVRLERPGFTSRRGGEGVGWLDNNAKDGREVQVCFGRGELSGSGGAFGSCSSQGLPASVLFCRVPQFVHSALCWKCGRSLGD